MVTPTLAIKSDAITHDIDIAEEHLGRQVVREVRPFRNVA